MKSLSWKIVLTVRSQSRQFDRIGPLLLLCSNSCKSDPIRLGSFSMEEGLLKMSCIQIVGVQSSRWTANKHLSNFYCRKRFSSAVFRSRGEPLHNQNTNCTSSDFLLTARIDGDDVKRQGKGICRDVQVEVVLVFYRPTIPSIGLMTQDTRRKRQLVDRTAQENSLNMGDVGTRGRRRARFSRTATNHGGNPMGSAVKKHGRGGICERKLWGQSWSGTS